jgi:hypothetical protein
MPSVVLFKLHTIAPALAQMGPLPIIFAFEATPGTTSNSLDNSEMITLAPAETLKRQFVKGLVKYIPEMFCRH